MVIQASWKHNDRRPVRVQVGLAKLAASLAMEIKIRITEPHRRQRLAILATREPHAMEALLAGCRNGRLAATPALVVSNRSDLAALGRKCRLPGRRTDHCAGEFCGATGNDA